MDRRLFLRNGSAAALSLSLLRNEAAAAPLLDGGGDEARRALTLDPSKLEAFVEPLPIPPVLKPVQEHRKDGRQHYRVEMREVHARVHRDLPPTRWWSYGGSVPGPTIEARRGRPVSVEWVNALPAKHFLPIDTTLCGAEPGTPEVRAVVHVHGAMVQPESDGYPEDWFVPRKSAMCEYPMKQDGASLWYHDHAMGIERLNMYAGLFGAFVIRDEEEDALGLPRGEREIPLFLFDRLLDPEGQLYYPGHVHAEGMSADSMHAGMEQMGHSSGARAGSAHAGSMHSGSTQAGAGHSQVKWASEAFGNLFLVNGKLLPYLEVEPRRYRFRVYNVSNARFFRLTLGEDLEFQQIGTEQGLLDAPVAVKRLTLAPAERADVVVDFSGVRGERIVMHNDLLPLMQFRVGEKAVADDSRVPVRLRSVARIQESEAVVTRRLTLNEYDDLYGKPSMMLLNKARWHDPVTEKPKLGSVEIWELVNLTSDTHPIHLHGTRFQVLDRRPFDAGEYVRSGEMRFRGAAVAPAVEERGWKDTVRANGRSVTRIIMRFDGYAGRYVWHCHTLEHAANEMMRPFEIVRG